MTPFTSFLVLESAAAYGRFGIQRRPRDPLWGAVPHAALELPAALGLGLFGCSRSAPPGQQVAADEVAASPVMAKAASAPPPPVAAGERLENRRAPSRPAVNQPKPAEVVSKTSPAVRGKGGGGYGKDQSVSSGLVGGKQAAKEGRASYVVIQKVCSDAARRSLAQRGAIWRNRLGRASSVAGWIGVYRQAASTCELPHWRDRRAMLDLVQQRVRTAAGVRQLLAAVRDRKGRDFVRRRLLKRAVTSAMNAALSGGGGIDWSIVEGTLARPDDPLKRLTQLRALCQQHRESRGCLLRLIRALIAARRSGEALTVAMKMRADGLATPELMQQIGDLLAAAGRPQQAMRVYSEIVEFSPDDPAARRLLGDIYLRHAWYEPAYRQYRTLTQRRPDNPMGLLRLAAAAAGTGRVDEALRLERKVAGGQGEPGPKDPRRWARLWSAARIGQLILAPEARRKESLRQSMERSLRRLQVVPEGGALVVLTWEDVAAPLSMGLTLDGKPLPWAEKLSATPTGLVAFKLRTVPAGELAATIGSAAAVQRAVPFSLTMLRGTGKGVKVVSKRGKAAVASRVAIKIP
jgi:Ca-activated chloride channel homolog